MNARANIDAEEQKAFQRLEPHLSVMDTHGPFKVSNAVKIPGPTATTIANWMHEYPDE